MLWRLAFRIGRPVVGLLLIGYLLAYPGTLGPEGYVITFPLAIIVGILAFYTPRKRLKTKFVELGTLAGKTRDEIIAAVGGPTSVSAIGEGKALLQWMEAGYHIALSFDGEVCEGVTHEHSAEGL